MSVAAADHSNCVPAPAVAPNEAQRWPPKPGVCLAVALVVAAVVQCYGLLAPPLHVDEILTQWIASAPTPAEVVQRTRTHSLGPVYYLLVHAVMRVVPDPTLATRGLSVVFGVACVAMVFAVGSALVDRSFGAVVCLIAALDTLIIHYAQEARPYTIALAGSLVAVWGLVRWRRGGTWRWLIVYTAGMAVLVGANYVFVLMVAPLGLFVLLAGATGRSRVRATSAFTLASLVALVAIVPALPNIRFATQHARVLGTFIQNHPMLSDPLILTKFTILSVVAAAAALVLAPRLFTQPATPGGVEGRRIREAALLALLWYAVPIAALQVLAWTCGVRLFLVRYLIVYLGGPLLLAALPTTLAGRRTRFPQVYTLILTAVLAMHLGGLFARYGMFAPKRADHGDLRPVVQAALRDTVGGDLILFQAVYIEGNLLNTHGTDPRLTEYLLAPLHALGPPTRARMLPLPAAHSIKPFAKYYKKVVGPTIAASGRVVLVSRGIAPAFDRWFRATYGSDSYATTTQDHRTGARFPGHMAVTRYTKRGSPLPHDPSDAQANAAGFGKETLP